MSITSNHKIRRNTDLILVVGADIAKKEHVARASDARDIGLGNPLFFDNSMAWKSCSKTDATPYPPSPRMSALSCVNAILAKVWDLSAREQWRQVQKFAGFNLKDNGSGKYKGQTQIAKRE
ncbi:hypothetical protein [Alicyclobacillus macrosporangiidus]|uniref:hypothetical protein n=1 Tax=Alicyclobacillus macrosporangiidus TaxID=392015 RepID=UPI0012DCE24A|nr:hypothetical protein [Alicyclobacillus macrosporangiidus]